MLRAALHTFAAPAVAYRATHNASPVITQAPVMALRAAARRPTRAHAAATDEASDLMMDNAMYCYQCEQTAKGTGCTTVGVCGKTPETASLQDLLTYSLKGLACWAHFAAQQGLDVPTEVYSLLNAATFACLTNVNFDDARFKEYILHCHELRGQLEQALSAKGVAGAPPSPALPFFDLLAHPAAWKPDLAPLPTEQLVHVGKEASLEHRRHLLDPTLLGLHETINYGLRGLAAYSHHAEVLGHRDADVDAFLAEAYAFLCSEEALDLGKVLAMVDATGAAGLKGMALLDHGNTSKFGHPTPTPVRITPKKGKAILISGHDLQDTYDLLAQTEGTGINIWTHGELLPAHGYPALKERFPHLVGNYGGAWYRQQKDFAEFPGAILMTTNCIVEPRKSYEDRIFTTGEVGWPGVGHIDGQMGKTKDYSALVSKALELPGFEWEPEESEAKFVTTGFARNAVLGVAGEVVKAVQEGNLKHIFLVGGCDGHEPERKYFTAVADKTPKDTLLLTLGCGKFRFYDHDFGMLPNTQLPRLLDMGQCNDAYSAVVVASKLAEVFGTDVNGLPLSLDLSWLEQKAVIILLTLLHLNVKNIRIGPKAPAFLTPEALQVLVDKYSLKVTDVKHPGDDVQAMLAHQLLLEAHVRSDAPPLPDIPAGALPSLARLEVYCPGMRSTVPRGWGGSPRTLPALQHLSLRLGLQGSLPAGWSLGFRRLRSLTLIALEQPAEATRALPAAPGRGGAGALPAAWASGFLMLRALHMNGLGLSGPLPPAWLEGGSFPSLAVLDLGDNALSGTLPPRLFAALPKLERLRVLSLDFTSNRLSGTAFPQDWLVPGAMPALGDVLLGRNPRLSGTLPARLPWHNLHTL
ncbi:hydroxylamine reductase [Micractinium conductrix]|uniref:Hydroxylamine reductase n=1 Tax=Micractinium conductrix TaxID=554055 RepID=A0A2P6V326_9CHLO|nr:hydroxylamine reductase [Micractinium conductrix]|eukprot:PSC68490.1 hydroxylamine reductase [Micractinium conductrix]